MPNDELRRELELLLTAVVEGTLGPDGRRELSRLLRREPEAQRLYVEYCQMHAMLRSAHGELSAVAPERGRRRGVRWLAVAGLLAVTIAVAAAVYVRTRTPDHSASVVAVQGDVRVVRDGTSSDASVGTALRPGDQIQTEAGAGAEVHLADGTAIRLGPASSVRLLLRQDGRCVELKGGSVSCDVRPQPRDKPLVFASPHADVTVLGTAFDLSVAPIATSVHVSQGRVRLSAGGHVADVGAGGLASADAQGVYTWSPVSRVDFAGGMTGLPAKLQTVYCDSESLHTAARHVVPAPENVALTKEGLRFVDAPGKVVGHGLAVMRWAEEIGGDVAVEVDVSAGPRWSLGFAVDGDSFEGYRVIFAAPSYPYGITIDSIHPSALTLLAQDPRPIPYERDHTLRVEKLGQRMRVWVDGELRIDTQVTHPLPAGRRRTVAISSFGEPPLIRGMRIWKAAPTGSGR